MKNKLQFLYSFESTTKLVNPTLKIYKFLGKIATTACKNTFPDFIDFSYIFLGKAIEENDESKKRILGQHLSLEIFSFFLIFFLCHFFIDYLSHLVFSNSICENGARKCSCRSFIITKNTKLSYVASIFYFYFN